MAKVVTNYVYPPIPMREYDWQAFYEDDEPNDAGGMRVGYGPTEADAIHDLIENYPETGEAHGKA